MNDRQVEKDNFESGKKLPKGKVGREYNDKFRENDHQRIRHMIAEKNRNL